MNNLKLRQSKFLAMFGLSITKVLMPDTLIAGNGYINIKKKKWLGLKDETENIKIEKVASVRLKNGFFWSDIVVETSGGASRDFKIKGVGKRKAKKGLKLINQML